MAMTAACCVASAGDGSVEFVGLPGVPVDEAVRLMTRAKFCGVCGIDDGATAILGEYMLTGPAVLVNADLRCGLQSSCPNPA